MALLSYLLRTARDSMSLTHQITTDNYLIIFKLDCIAFYKTLQLLKPAYSYILTLEALKYCINHEDRVFFDLKSLCPKNRA